MEFFIPENIRLNPEKTKRLIKIYQLKNGIIHSKAIIRISEFEIIFNTIKDIIHLYKLKTKTKYGYSYKDKDNKKINHKKLTPLYFNCDCCTDKQAIIKSIYSILKVNYILCKSCSSFFRSCMIERGGDNNNMSNKSVSKRKNISSEEATKYHGEMCKKSKTDGKSKDTRAYWIKRGHTEEEAKKILSKTKPQSINYWLERGYCKKGAIFHARASMASNLEYYIKRNYINPEEERAKFVKSHPFNNLKSGNSHSKIAKELFDIIYEKLPGHYKYATLNEEYCLSSNGNSLYRYDFTDIASKKIIEFNGDYWHANPSIYNAEDIITRMNISAKQLWEKDKEKIDVAITQGFSVLVIWEKDYRNDKEVAIHKCLEFLKNEN